MSEKFIIYQSNTSRRACCAEKYKLFAIVAWEIKFQREIHKVFGLESFQNQVWLFVRASRLDLS